MIEYNRIDHIAMGVADLDQQASLLSGLFGLTLEGAWTDERDSARGMRFVIPGTGDLRFEIVTPTAADSPYQKFLDSPRGPGVHHVAFEVNDLEATTRAMDAVGVRAASGSNESRLLVSPDGAGEGVQMQFFAGDPHGELTAGSASGPGGPNLGIVGFDHLCIAYPDRDELSRHLAKLLGMRQIWRTPDGAWPDFGDCVLEVPGKQLHWEIIQPMGDDSFIRKFIDARGPAVHHVAFEVADFDAALAACEHHGVPTFDEHDDETEGIRWRDAFIHPKHTGGLLTQIYWEAQPNTWIRSDKVRPKGYTA